MRDMGELLSIIWIERFIVCDSVSECSLESDANDRGH
jgi:hypothetical protein